MGINLDKEQILETIKKIIKNINRDASSSTIDIDDITEGTDIRNLDMDSLDTMEYLFAVDEAFGKEIPDKIFQEKELAIIGNLISYLVNNS